MNIDKQIELVYQIWMYSLCNHPLIPFFWFLVFFPFFLLLHCVCFFFCSFPFFVFLVFLLFFYVCWRNQCFWSVLDCCWSVLEWKIVVGDLFWTETLCVRWCDAVGSSFQRFVFILSFMVLLCYLKCVNAFIER